MFAETVRRESGQLEEDMMAIDVSKTLRQALTRLETEGRRIDRQIAAIESALALDGAGVSTRAGRKRDRKGMSPAARKAVGRRMKAYWAKRKAKGGKKGK